MEGLCNQLMAVFRAIGEALYYAGQNQHVCILLGDVQTRNSVDLDVQPYFSPIPVDAFVDVAELTALLAAQNISVRRFQDNPGHREPVISCRRYPLRIVSPDESRALGVFLGHSFPFAKRAARLANTVMGFMSRFSVWNAIQLRIEEDVLHLSDVRNMGMATYTETQLKHTIDTIARRPNLSAAYIASGIQEERYRQVADILQDTFPYLTILRKNDVLKHDPDLRVEFASLCLEEQALIDWLVCVCAPLFSGQHTSSYGYLAGYLRHYRGAGTESTDLWPAYQPLWDEWFPRV